MPAPTASQIEPLVMAALASANIQGDAAAGLSSAVAETTAAALQMFVAQAMVMPGIAVVAPPPTGTGSTVGPGLLMAPPAGGPDTGQIQPIAEAQLQTQGIRGDGAGGLAAVVAGAIAQGIVMFSAQVVVAPGIAIAGFVTSAPGSAVMPGPQKSALEPIVNGLMTSNRLDGAHAPALASALSEAIAAALGMLAQQVMVAPGIACTPAATASPGRLV